MFLKQKYFVPRTLINKLTGDKRQFQLGLSTEQSLHLKAFTESPQTLGSLLKVGYKLLVYLESCNTFTSHIPQS